MMWNKSLEDAYRAYTDAFLSSFPLHHISRVDVGRKGSLPSLALPSVWEGQALAARILPLPSEKIEMYILALKM